MKERPILFSGPMVRAILDGRKTQTRRIVKPQPVGRIDPVFSYGDGKLQCAFGPQDRRKDGSIFWRNAPGDIGDRLWVRETWGRLFYSGDDEPVFWRADYSMKDLETQALPRWKPSIHMPRWASRINLEITGVRVERLNEISEKDAWAEGCEGTDDDVTGGISGYAEYRQLWESINGAGSWDKNPICWVIDFKRI